MSQMAPRKDPGRADVERRFSHSPTTEETQPQHEAVYADFKRLALKLYKDLPEGRHKAIALDTLQDAMMWANASVAHDTGRDASQDGVLARVADIPPESEAPAETPKVDGRSKAARAAKAAGEPASVTSIEAGAKRRVARRPRA